MRAEAHLVAQLSRLYARLPKDPAAYPIHVGGHVIHWRHRPRRVTAREPGRRAWYGYLLNSFDIVIRSDYNSGVTCNELIRLLKKHGCRFEPGSRHIFVYNGKRRSTIPRHPAEEINPKTLKSILKDLGIKR